MITTTEQQIRWMASEARPDETLLRWYRRAQLRASLAATLARLCGRSTRLQTLDELVGGRMVYGQHDAGPRSVPIAQILASEGRSDDFDTHFRPLQTHTWERWRSVALALCRGETLPPVELIAVGEHYAVRDGHHRISVAVALGQREVDAVVSEVVVV